MIKKALTWLFVAFLIYYVIAAPRDAAETVNWAGETVQDAARSLLTFFDGLTPER